MLEPDLRRQRVARITLAVDSSIIRLRVGISTLDHEMRNNPVKKRVIIETIGNEFAKIPTSSRCGNVVQFNHDATERSFQNDNLLLRLDIV